MSTRNCTFVYVYFKRNCRHEIILPHNISRRMRRIFRFNLPDGSRSKWLLRNCTFEICTFRNCTTKNVSTLEEISFYTCLNIKGSYVKCLTKCLVIKGNYEYFQLGCLWTVYLCKTYYIFCRIIKYFIKKYNLNNRKIKYLIYWTLFLRL